MDPRQKRTRRRLRQALIQCLREMSFEAIQIVPLAERADVSLPTFYRNYANKVDLLEDTISNFIEYLEDNNYDAALSQIELLTPAHGDHLLPALKFLEADKVFFRRLLQSPHHALVMKTIRAVMLERVQAGQVDWTPQEADLIVGCVLGNIYQWVTFDLPYTAEEIARSIHWSSLYGVLMTRDENATARNRLRHYITVGNASPSEFDEQM